MWIKWVAALGDLGESFGGSCGRGTGGSGEGMWTHSAAQPCVPDPQPLPQQGLLAPRLLAPSQLGAIKKLLGEVCREAAGDDPAGRRDVSTLSLCGCGDTDGATLSILPSTHIRGGEALNPGPCVRSRGPQSSPKPHPSCRALLQECCPCRPAAGHQLQCHHRPVQQHQPSLRTRPPPVLCQLTAPR